MKQFEHDILDPNITNGKSHICGLSLLVGAIIGLLFYGHDAESFSEELRYV